MSNIPSQNETGFTHSYEIDAATRESVARLAMHMARVCNTDPALNELFFLDVQRILVWSDNHRVRDPEGD